MAIRAILFDLGNTLVDYYTTNEFPMVLRRCVQECAALLGRSGDSARDGDLIERALLLNREQPDYAVHPLATRLRALFGAHEPLDEASVQVLEAAFLRPIFATARLDPQAIPVLETLRGLGIKTGVVSNAPWGSPARAWREELTRHGLLDMVDVTVFCMDVGWRKPHRAPFDRALALLEAAPAEALFVGDDHRWDIVGARNAGIGPVLIESELPTSPPDHLSIQDLGGILSLATEGRVVASAPRLK